MPEHTELSSDGRRPLPSWVFWVVIALIGATVVLAAWGLAVYPPATPECGSQERRMFFTWFYRLIVLFEPSEANLHLGGCFPDAWQLSAARLTGFFAFSFAAGVGIYKLLQTRIAEFWIWL